LYRIGSVLVDEAGDGLVQRGDAPMNATPDLMQIRHAHMSPLHRDGAGRA
jgi:hypothetical protein